MAKSKNKSKYIFSLATLITTILANIAIALLIVWSMRYSGFDSKIFFSIFGVAICLLIILDIVFFVGYNYKDNNLKIVTCVIAVVMLLIGSIGSFYVGRVNKAVNNIIQNSDGEQYEIVRVAFATYDNNRISEIKDLKGLTVGSLNPVGISAATVGREYLDNENLNVSYKDYNMTSELYEALVDGEIDAAIFPTTYRSQIEASDEAELYEDILEKTNDIFTLEKEVKTAENESSKKDLSSEPFTILLIGFAPEPGGGGLTDTIILASVNPQTMQVTMTSIPRDSYVPISCYGNNRSKINEAGAASKACLMETVGNLLEVDVDFYMEVNFKGLVDIVDALGGIYIDSPIEFVGQTSSSIRGEKTVWVPAGPYTANGEQALAFARERHAMPGSDFQRQLHQQQVISEIAKKLIELRDANKALAVMEAAGENFSTNLSLNQLMGVFNYIVNAENYTDLSQFNVLDIKSTRLTGYTYWFYNYAMRIPLWSYYLYDGSIKDNVALLDNTLGDFTNIKQDKYFKFFAEYPYQRGLLYYEYYDEPHVPENIPAFVKRFASERWTLDEVRAWANETGASLDIVYIQSDDPRYIEGAIGIVVDQSHAYGTLVEELGGPLTIWVCGDIPEEDKVPLFVGSSLKAAQDWANANGIELSIITITAQDANYDASKAGLITAQNINAGTDKHKIDTLEVTYMEKRKVDLTEYNSFAVGKTTKDTIISWCTKNFTSVDNCIFSTVKTNDKKLDGTLAANPTYGNNDGSEGFYASSWVKIQIYAYEAVVCNPNNQIPDGNGGCTDCPYGVENGACKPKPQEPPTCNENEEFVDGVCKPITQPPSSGGDGSENSSGETQSQQ